MMDRWLEIDIDWFGPPPADDRIDQFAERLAPLLAGAAGERGVMLNVGWLVDIVTEWQGEPGQRLPLRSRRYARWRDTTYDDLRVTIGRLRTALVASGIADAKVGIFVTAPGHVVMPADTGELYDLYSDWSERHPELYPLDLSRLPGPDLDVRVPLHADTYPYASHPQGVAEGTSFARLFADQWGSLSRFVGLDAIHLRDAFWGPMLYSRKAQYGTVAVTTPAEAASWTDAVADFFVQIKAANPDATVMAYSSAVSQTAEWRAGCVDMEKVVAAGGVDVFIDQTWGGAWQDWWDDHWKAWTFQLANLLGHAVPLRRANEQRAARGLPPCRHWKLIETWDGWEPWDTLHRTPGKLEWAIWAFSHATARVAGRRTVPEGTYLSWMNDWDLQLLSATDVAFLSETLDAAEESALEMTEPLGPVLVIDHEAVDAVHSTTPGDNVGEWIEDQAALVMKSGAPILEAVDPTAIGVPSPDGWLAQLPSSASFDAVVEAGTLRLPGGSGAFIASGRFDRLAPELLAAAGVGDVEEIRSAGYFRDEPTDPRLPRGDSVHLADHAVAAATGEVRYSAGGAPLLVGEDAVWAWQAPDLNNPADPQFPRSQLGTVNPHHEVARVLTEHSRAIQVQTPDPGRPVTVHAWRSPRGVTVLAGNLETGWIGDSRYPRTVTVRLRAAALPAVAADLAVTPLPTRTPNGDFASAVDANDLVLTIHVPASGLALAVISRKDLTTR